VKAEHGSSLKGNTYVDYFIASIGWLDDRGFNSWAGAEDFYLFQNVQTSSGATQLSI